jgi:hypothetical protein
LIGLYYADGVRGDHEVWKECQYAGIITAGVFTLNVQPNEGWGLVTYKQNKEVKDDQATSRVYVSQ